MKIINKIIALLLASAIVFPNYMNVYAEENDNFTKEEILYELYDQYWKDTAVGTENPEGSLEYHILTEWLDNNYGKSESESGVWRWYKMYDIQHAYRDYHDEYTKEWHYNDDDGKFSIEYMDPETGETGKTLYRFELIDGKWNMIDANDHTVDTFEPHGGDGSWEKIKNGEDDEEDIDDFIKNMHKDKDSTNDSQEKKTNTLEKKTNPIPEEHRVTGQVSQEETSIDEERVNQPDNTKAGTEKIKDRKSAVDIVAVIAAIIAVVVIVLLFRNRKGDKK
jgi:hypothetical protein